MQTGVEQQSIRNFVEFCWTTKPLFLKMRPFYNIFFNICLKHLCTNIKKTYLHMYKSVNPVKVPHSHAVKTRYCADAAVQESFCFSATTDFFYLQPRKWQTFTIVNKWLNLNQIQYLFTPAQILVQIYPFPSVLFL